MLNAVTIDEVRFSNFRNYSSAKARLAQGNIIYGSNGSGKTNFLEAITLFGAGKGLKGSNFEDCLSPFNKQLQIDLYVKSTFGKSHLKVLNAPALDTSLDQFLAKKILWVDGAPLKNMLQASEYLKPVWLTPKLDVIFLEDNQCQRDFFDKLISNLNPSHKTRLKSYQRALRERNTLLKQKSTNNALYSALETIMAQEGVCIIASRLEFINMINNAAVNYAQDRLYPITLSTQGPIETLIQEDGWAALACENLIKEKLEQSRKQDLLTGSTSLNILLSSIVVKSVMKNLLARQCSTGEQKYILITLILIYAYLLVLELQHTPTLLLDEALVHLDKDIRYRVLNELLNLPLQFFITTTEKNDFMSHKSSLKFVKVSNNQTFNV